MEELEPQVKEAGITVLNEIGLDPGIDHLYAVKAIEDIHREGGKVVSFTSYCGGLPAPEASGNPLGYKFSWSSRGVLLALRNAAKFYKDGKIEEIAGPDLMASAKPYFIMPGFAFVAYANRDSTPYRERYNIPEAQTVIRGTLRYQGFPEFVKVLVDTGFLSDEKRDFLTEPIPWATATQKILGASSNEPHALAWAVESKTKFADNDEKKRIMSGMQRLGLFSAGATITPRGNPLDTLCATLEEKMQYGPGERDMVMLQHKFEVDNHGEPETWKSTLVDYGDPNGYSAMARLVGVPAGVACLMVLNGKITEKGVLAPVKWGLAEPLLVELRKYGIQLKEEVERS